VQEVLANNRKVVGGDSRQLLYLPMSPTRGSGAQQTSAPAALPPELLAPTVTATPESTIRPPRSIDREGSKQR
jgi:modulator of FtsH protease HflK